MLTKDEAQAALDQAIVDHAQAFGMVSDGEMLSEYAVVSSWTPMDEQTGETNYLVQFHRDEIPTHAAVGLFMVGQRMSLEEDDGDE